MPKKQRIEIFLKFQKKSHPPRWTRTEFVVVAKWPAVGVGVNVRVEGGWQAGWLFVILKFKGISELGGRAGLLSCAIEENDCPHLDARTRNCGM